jgi:cytochrome c peroxidase
MPRRFCACVLCAVAAALAYFLLFGQPQTATAQEARPVSFINDVAPILKENCFACHDAKKKSGKYEMTTYEKLMAGGANGEPIVNGKPRRASSTTSSSPPPNGGCRRATRARRFRKTRPR